MAMQGIHDPNARRTPAHWFALVAGLVYVSIGVLGFFVTGFDNFVGHSDETLILFEVNPFHNVVHLTIGALWLGAAFMLAPVATHGVNFAIAGFYLLAALGGFLGLGIFDDLLAIDGVLHPDNFLHLGTGLAALPFGVGVLRSHAVPSASA